MSERQMSVDATLAHSYAAINNESKLLIICIFTLL